MKIDLNDSLPTCVARQYERAKQSQKLIFSETQLTTIRTSSGVPFQLRYCPALAKKPKQNDNTKPAAERKPDPFMNPSADLFIANISESGSVSHILVLNKFPVIAEHFILATKSDKPQTGVLEPDDLQATYTCLQEWERHGHSRRLFAFFNSGEHSGASQPHRHLQFLPVESMRAGDDDTGWALLADLITTKPDLPLPFVKFAKVLPVSPTARQLHDIYTGLLAEAIASAQSYDTRQYAGQVDDRPGAVAISYNMAMTTSSMVIVPRRNEGTALYGSAGTEVGFVALNGTILGGTMMVKLEEEWEVLRSSSAALDMVLEKIGIPQNAKSPGSLASGGKM